MYARPSFNKTAALLAIVVGVGAGSYGIASAASGSSAATTTAAAPAAPSGATAQNPWGHQRGDEKVLTGTALAKVKSIVEGKVRAARSAGSRPTPTGSPRTRRT
jgi:hypothetical protein